MAWEISVLRGSTEISNKSPELCWTLQVYCLRLWNKLSKRLRFRANKPANWASSLTRVVFFLDLSYWNHLLLRYFWHFAKKAFGSERLIRRKFVFSLLVWANWCARARVCVCVKGGNFDVIFSEAIRAYYKITSKWNTEWLAMWVYAYVNTDVCMYYICVCV